MPLREGELALLCPHNEHFVDSLHLHCHCMYACLPAANPLPAILAPPKAFCPAASSSALLCSVRDRRLHLLCVVRLQMSIRTKALPHFASSLSLAAGSLVPLLYSLTLESKQSNGTQDNTVSFDLPSIRLWLVSTCHLLSSAGVYTIPIARSLSERCSCGDLQTSISFRAPAKYSPPGNSRRWK